MVRRGEVWLIALDPTVGREIRKARPCLVISPDELNASLATFTAAPLTTGSHPARFRIKVRFQRKEGLVLLDQLRTLDRARLIKRMGRVDAATLSAVLAALQDMFAE